MGLTVERTVTSRALQDLAIELMMPIEEDSIMNLAGTVILVSIITVVFIYLFGLQESVSDFFSSVLSMPDPGYVENQALYNLAKICIFIIANVGMVKILVKR